VPGSALRAGRALLTALFVWTVAPATASFAEDAAVAGAVPPLVADSDGTRVVLSWVPRPGLDAVGYHVMRAVRPDGPYAPVNEWLIPARPGMAAPGYSYTDLGVESRAVYYYLLEEVRAEGARIRRGPVRIQVVPGAREASGGAAYGPRIRVDGPGPSHVRDPAVGG
jgi:hypothetical protein